MDQLGDIRTFPRDRITWRLGLTHPLRLDYAFKVSTPPRDGYRDRDQRGSGRHTGGRRQYEKSRDCSEGVVYLGISDPDKLFTELQQLREEKRRPNRWTTGSRD